MDKHPIDLGRITRETLDQLARALHEEPLPPRDQPAERSAPYPSKPWAHDDEETSSRAGHLQSGKDQGAGVPLEEAPEQFFDQDLWSDFVSRCGSRQAALRKISYPEDGFFVAARRSVAKEPTLTGAKAREQEEVAQLGQRIVARFCERLVGGESMTTGMQPPSIERIGMPGELWSKLIPNFEDSKAEGGGYFFAHIRVIEASHVASTEPQIVKRLGAWLTKRREQHGDELKKTLLHLAHEEFGEAFKSRAFDVAYRRIYGRKRGRPPGLQGR